MAAVQQRRIVGMWACGGAVVAAAGSVSSGFDGGP